MVRIATARSQLSDSLNTDVQGFQLLPDNALRHTPAEVLDQKPRTAVLREREGVKTQPSFPSRDRSALTAARNPSAVDGTTINFSDFNWAVRPPGQDARNQARKARVSFNPEIKIGVLLGRCPAGRQALRVAPTGMPLRGPDMSLDMRRLGVSVETPDSEESMAVGLRLTLWLKPWPFYMVFVVFICPSIGRLASLVGVVISTKVLNQ